MRDLKPSTKLLIRTFIYCVFISFIMLLFTSCNSFLYSSNNVNNYMINKLYNTGRFIPFILEIVCNTLLLFSSYRMFRLFISKYSSKICIPLIMVSIVTCNSFLDGGTSSEFIISLVMICFYYYLRHFKKKMLGNKEMFICGILSGLVFMIDYYLIGFFLGFIIFIVLDYFINRHQKKNGFKRLMSFIIGFILICGLFIFIEYSFYDLNDFLNSYFVKRFNINISNYKNILTSIWNLGVINYWLILLSIILLFRWNVNGYCKIGIIFMFLFMVLGIYINYYDNNSLVLLSYFIIGLLGIGIIFDNKLLDFIKNYYKGILVFITIISIFLCLFGANNIDNINLLINNSIVFKK